MKSFRQVVGVFQVAWFFSCFALATATFAQTINYIPAPTGIPEVDWQNLQNGIDAAEPGDTLRLAVGTYRIHRPLEFQEWNGSLTGASHDRDDTVIEISRASNGDLFRAIHNPMGDDADFTGSQVFETPAILTLNSQGIFRIANLTIKIDEIGVAEKSYVLDSNTGDVAFYIDVWENNNSRIIGGTLGAEVDVVIENSSFLGAAANQFFGQPNHGIQLYGHEFNTVGNYTVRDSNFEGIGTNVINVISMSGAQILIEDNTFSDSPRPIVLWNNSGCTVQIIDNSASNLLQSAVFVWDIPLFPPPAQPCHVTVRGLKVNGGGGVWWDQDLYDNPSVGVFTHNTIEQKPDSQWAGFELWGGSSSTLTISHNRISGEGAFLWGPLFAFDLQGATINNNEISGSGPAAVYFAPLGIGSVSEVTLLGNNFQQWRLESSLGVEPVAPIWLGPNTHNNTLVGGPNGQNVADEGVDNVLIGVNNMGANIGQDIREAIRRRTDEKFIQMELYTEFR